MPSFSNQSLTSSSVGLSNHSVTCLITPTRPVNGSERHSLVTPLLLCCSTSLLTSFPKSYLNALFCIFRFVTSEPILTSFHFNNSAQKQTLTQPLKKSIVSSDVFHPQLLHLRERIKASHSPNMSRNLFKPTGVLSWLTLRRLNSNFFTSRIINHGIHSQAFLSSQVIVSKRPLPLSATFASASRPLHTLQLV